jgi:hypothetical protein
MTADHETRDIDRIVRMVGDLAAAKSCLRWASGLAIGVRGGWPANEVQQVLSACARGEDWQALRDKLQQRRTR